MSQSQDYIERFLRSVDLAAGTLRDERRSGMISGGRVSDGLVITDIPNELVVVGDLHGDIQSLEIILDEINSGKFLSNLYNKIIFLGDYVDRGSRSVDVLLRLCELKHEYPGSVILMRGNHEAPKEFPFPSHDLPEAMLQCFGKDWDVAYEKALDLFQMLTLVTVIEGKMVLVHGGFPAGLKGGYELAVREASGINPRLDILEELLWNDPRTLRPGVVCEDSRRLFGRHFGISVSKTLLKSSNTCAIVRGHEPCHGYRIDHDGRVMTIFSCAESYPAFEPSYLSVKGSQLNSIQNAHDLVPYVRKIKKGVW